MKTGVFRKGISMMAVAAMTMALLTGCGEHSNASGDMLTKKRDKLDSVTTASLEKTTESVTIAPDKEGSGFCMSATARDYKDGALVFESFEHMGEDEFNNIEVSDALASIIDSVQFSK